MTRRLTGFIHDKFIIFTKAKIATSFLHTHLEIKHGGLRFDIDFNDTFLKDYTIKWGGDSGTNDRLELLDNIKKEITKIYEGKSKLDIYFLYRDVKDRFYSAFVQDNFSGDHLYQWLTLNAPQGRIPNEYFKQYLINKFSAEEVTSFFDYLTDSKNLEKFKDKSTLVDFLKEDTNNLKMFEILAEEILEMNLNKIRHFKHNHNESYLFLYYYLYNTFDKNKCNFVKLTDLNNLLNKYLETNLASDVRENPTPSLLSAIVRKSFESKSENLALFESLFSDDLHLYDIFEAIRENKLK